MEDLAEDNAYRLSQFMSPEMKPDPAWHKFYNRLLLNHYRNNFDPKNKYSGRLARLPGMLDGRPRDTPADWAPEIWLPAFNIKSYLDSLSEQERQEVIRNWSAMRSPLAPPLLQNYQGRSVAQR